MRSISSTEAQTVDLSNVAPAKTIHATLQYRHNVQGIGWHEVYALYQAAGGSTVLSPSGANAGSSPVFAWTSQERARRYELEV